MSTTAATLVLLFASATQTYNLPPGLISALCWVESRHVVSAMHIDDGGSASVGVCQVKLATARLLGFKGSETALRRPDVNVHYASLYLSNQLRRYRGDVYKGIAAYNSGTYRVSTKGLAKNDQYVRKVLTYWGEGR